VGHTELIGKSMFTDFVLPFEITSILLLVAIVGSVILAKRKL
jgi:NADH-quinone oxidoreductase subunit J